MVILASEDIGNADPQALPVAVAAAHAVEHVGHARGGARARPVRGLPRRSRRSPTRPTRRSARRGPTCASTAPRRPPRAALQSPPRGYDYPHDRPGHVSPQELLPDPVVGTRFYAPDDAEAALRERLQAILQARGR